MSHDDGDLLAQLGEIARTRTPSAAEQALDDLEAAHADPAAAGRVAARAETSEDWARAAEAAQPLDASERARVLEAVRASARGEAAGAPASSALTPHASPRRYVFGVALAAAAAVLLSVFIGGDPTLPQYVASSSSGAALLSWPARADGRPLAEPRRPEHVVLSPEIATDAQPEVAVFVGEVPLEVVVERAPSGAVRIEIVDASRLVNGRPLTVLVARTRPEGPAACRAPDCQRLELPVVLRRPR